MNRIVPGVLSLTLLAQVVQAQTPSLPTTCVSAVSSVQGNEWWQEVKLNLTNNCAQDLDFQNAIVRFKTKGDLSNASFWGQYSPLSYPDNNLVIQAEKQSDGNYLSSLSLHFPMDNASSNILPKGRTITIQFGGKDADVLSGSTNVYLQANVPVSKGTLVIDNVGVKPSGVTQSYALGHLRLNNTLVKDVQLPWATKTQVKDLNTGNYALSVDQLADSAGNNYLPTIVPDSITIEKDKTVTARLTFTKINKFGAIKFDLGPVPSRINAYTVNPIISLTNPDGGAVLNKTLTWGKTTTFSDLNNGGVYTFSTPVISFNGQKCSPQFTPARATAAATAPTVKLSYTCTAVTQVSETIKVSGAPSNLSSLKVTVLPNDQSSPVIQTISLTNGSGSSVYNLVQGGIYTLQTEAVSGYSSSFSPDPFVAAQNGEVNINFKAGSNRVNVIGFFQTFDNRSPSVWAFDGDQSIAKSGYNILIDAFWVNYPYCWGDGSNIPGRGSPIPECKNISNEPGPGLSNTIDKSFWDNFAGGFAPDQPGPAYNQYWTSLHTTGPNTISKLRTQINSTKANVKLLAGIGGWNMGGSAAGELNTPKTGKPGWDALLASPEAFAAAMQSIMNIKFNGQPLYDGIDIDIETLYGRGCKSTPCTLADSQQATDDMVASIVAFKKINPTAILSISPRASDLACEKQYCSWNNADGVGFVGETLQKLALQGIYFDDVNPQFYNEDAARNIPNGYDANGKPLYGAQVINMLKIIKKLNIIGPKTTFNIGVLAKTPAGGVDTGGAPAAGNPGVDKASVKVLWNLLTTDPAIKSTGITINGLMTWGANLALDGQGVGGNVRTTSSNENSCVPWNWGADLVQNN